MGNRTSLLAMSDLSLPKNMTAKAKVETNGMRYFLSDAFEASKLAAKHYSTAIAELYQPNTRDRHFRSAKRGNIVDRRFSSNAYAQASLHEMIILSQG